jgi:hypothetical protein
MYHVLGREENTYRLSARKPEVIAFGGSRYEWGDNIWILKRNRWKGWKWMYVLEEREHVK